MGQWYVIVEHIQYGEWALKAKVAVDGDREAALARAEEMSRGHSGDLLAPERSGRLVFRTSPTSWLVEVSHSYGWDKSDEAPSVSTWHVRISVAELEYVKEMLLPEPDPPKRGFLRKR